jgi:hypothetical protein
MENTFLVENVALTLGHDWAKWRFGAESDISEISEKFAQDTKHDVPPSAEQTEQE